MSFGIPGDFEIGNKVEVSAFNMGQSWNLELIKLHGVEHNYGMGVKVGVLDTGYSMQEGLPIPREIMQFGQSNNRDGAGHGTHVFGIVAAIARNADFYICKVLGDNGSGSNEDIAKGIVYLVDSGCQVINMSVGGKSNVKEVKDAIDYAHEKGVVCVCSSGNSGKDEKFYPSAYEQPITVGAVDKYASLAKFSTKGIQLDIVAPGVDIVSHWIDGTKRSSNGTSMAAPHVTGVVALIIDHFRTEHGHLPTVDEVKATLYNNAQDLGLLGWDEGTGNGLVQVQFHEVVKDEKCDAPIYMRYFINVIGYTCKRLLKMKSGSD